jgi:hypothetical protein
LIQTTGGIHVTTRLVLRFNVLKIDIGGLTGLIAPLVGKQPPAQFGLTFSRQDAR